MNKRIVIIGGGTMVDVAPHFSLCAPAFGLIANELFDEFGSNEKCEYSVHLVLTRMAGGDKIRTNEDLSDYINILLNDESVACIIMSAAICDFQAGHMISIDTNAKDPEWKSNTEFGRQVPRLSSKENHTVTLEPTEKLIDRIKKVRQDIYLVTFKTTSNDSESLVRKSSYNLLRSGCDMVFGNDIVEHKNITVTDETLTSYEKREYAVKGMVKDILEALSA